MGKMQRCQVIDFPLGYREGCFFRNAIAGDLLVVISSFKNLMQMAKDFPRCLLIGQK
jgi:hypothetical protein